MMLLLASETREDPLFAIRPSLHFQLHFELISPDMTLNVNPLLNFKKKSRKHITCLLVLATAFARVSQQHFGSRQLSTGHCVDRQKAKICSPASNLVRMVATSTGPLASATRASSTGPLSTSPCLFLTGRDGMRLFPFACATRLVGKAVTLAGLLRSSLRLRHRRWASCRRRHRCRRHRRHRRHRRCRSRRDERHGAQRIPT